MRLRSKLFLGFTGVLIIVIALGVLMTLSLQEMARQARLVDKVDSAIIEAITAQGRALRFILYKDSQYAEQATQGMLAAQRTFEEASEFVSLPRNRTLLEGEQKLIKDAENVFVSIVENSRKRTEVEGRLLPQAASFTAVLETVKGNVGVLLEEHYSTDMMNVYKALVNIGEQFRDSRVLTRLYFATPTQENESKTRASMRDLASSIKNIEAQATDPRNAALMRELVGNMAKYENSFQDLIANTVTDQKYFVQFREIFVELVASGVQLSRNATGNMLGTSDSSQFSMLAGTGVLIVLCMIIAWLLARNVLAQLGKDPGELAGIARRVTGGDYNIDDGSTKIGVYGDIVGMVGSIKTHIESAQHESARAADESRNAKTAMQQAEAASAEAKSKTESMLKAADRLEEVANIVSSASAELSAQIEQSERGASEQAARVTETATAMEEMNSTVLEVAKNAGSASDVSSKTRDKAEAGALVVQQAVASIQEVQKQAVHLKEDMIRLDENAKAISQIMGVISDIADQTNLLALNAAIEAARAGDAGRGFAVVADEVRKLAEKTMASTTDVGNAIKAIQESASQSMKQVDMSVKSIEEATTFANRSGDALQEIVAMVDSTADQVRAIATASEQQSASSEEINQSINQVNTIAGETARAMEEAARAVSDLAAQAQALSSLIEDMKRG